MKKRKMENGYFCTECGNHHYSYGTIGIAHKEFKLKEYDDKNIYKEYYENGQIEKECIREILGDKETIHKVERIETDSFGNISSFDISGYDFGLQLENLVFI